MRWTRGKRIGVLCQKMLILCTVLFALPLVAISAQAEWTPDKPIHIICTTDPGSTYDIQARVLATEMSKDLGVPVVVDNVPGGGHQTGTIRAYRSRGDGYTLLYTSTSNLANNELIKRAPWKSFDFVFLATTYDAMKGGSGVMAPKALGSLDDILKSGKTIRWGTAGAGSTPYIQAVTYGHSLGMNSTFVAGYSGPDMFAAAARGEVDLIAVPLRYAAQWKDDLNVVLIDSIGGFQNEYGNVPSLNSLGHPEAETHGLVHVLVAPPKTPADVASVLAASAEKAAKGEAMQQLHMKSIAEGTAYNPGGADDAQQAMKIYWDTLVANKGFIMAAIKAQ